MSACGETHCITCGDVAIEMTVVAIEPGDELAVCRSPDGATETVDIALIQHIRPAERLLVHAGTAIASIDTREVTS